MEQWNAESDTHQRKTWHSFIAFFACTLIREYRLILSVKLTNYGNFEIKLRLKICLDKFNCT